MKAGETLASTLDYEKTLQVLADLAVPRVACFCVVDIVAANGGVRRLAMAHVDPAQVAALSRTAAFLPDATGDSFAGRLLAGGEPVRVSPVTDDWLRDVARDEPHLQLMRELAATSLILVPLVAREHVLGVLVLASTQTDRFYTADDVNLARELGRIASVAIDNARLYRQARDALQARETVLRVVAHDLRNPISTVSMATALLADQGIDTLGNGLVGRTLQIIRRSTERAERMLRDLLDVSRLEMGRLTLEPLALPVTALLDEAIETHRHAAAEREVELRNMMSRPLPRVVADLERVFQVLDNIIGNALKFTPRGGTIEVRAEAGEHEVHVWVADAGLGIAPDELPHVFEPFWQKNRTDRRGLGLGLPS